MESRFNSGPTIHFFVLCELSQGKTLSKVTAAFENLIFYPSKGRHILQSFP